MIGTAGQAALRRADIAILGVGALGSVAAELMARAGVGKLRLIDRDVVQASNLQRQSLFTEADAAQERSKVEAAAEMLQRINAQVQYDALARDVVPDNIESLLEQCDLVIDATDNFPSRLLLNDWAVRHAKPWVHGGCVGTAGQFRLFDGATSPCFRCLVPELPPPESIQTCDTAGVLGSATHVIASYQVAEAIKWIVGKRDAIRRAVTRVDLWSGRQLEIEISPQLAAQCPVCSQRRFDFLQGAAGRRMQEGEKLCGRDSVQITGRPAIDPRWLRERIGGGGEIIERRFFTRLVIADQCRMTFFKDGRILIDGTDDIGRAKAWLDRYIGS